MSEDDDKFAMLMDCGKDRLSFQLLCDQEAIDNDYFWCGHRRLRIILYELRKETMTDFPNY